MQTENSAEKSRAEYVARPASAPFPPVAATRGQTAIAVIASLVLPGLGHLVLKRWGRGLVVGLSIAAMFALGFVMEGHLFTPVRGEWLTWFYTLLDMGMGLPYLVCLIADLGFRIEPAQAARITFEYGNTFLAVAGALNLLSALDVFDIAVGRKA